jgi:RNA polymerase sigma-B factor
VRSSRVSADSPEELRKLFVDWQRGGDRAAREALVERYMPLARNLARRYGHSSEPFEDLFQVASLGLLKAIDRFEVGRGHSFRSFAVPTILGEMRRYFRDSGWAVHVPRGAQERALRVRHALEARHKEGETPTVNEIAEYLELDVEQVLDALSAIQAYETLSLDAPCPGAEEDAMTYADTLGEPDQRYELVDFDVTVRAVLGHIPPRERRILHMRFAEDLTQTEIGARVGISQMQVSRLLRRSLQRLHALTHAPGEPS